MKKQLCIITLLILAIFGWHTSVALAATSDTVTVDAIVAEGTSSVEISETAIDFGSVVAGKAAHRFGAGPMTVSYFAANPAWTIRVYTDNSPGGGAEPEKAGLVGADLTTYVPLKIYNVNYGPSGDLEDDAYWTTTVLRIPEKDEHTADPYTWRRLCYTGAELDPAGFENWLAFDAQGVKAQAYSTTLTVEIIHQ